MDLNNATGLEWLFTFGAIIGLMANGWASWLNGTDWWYTRKSHDATSAERGWALWLFSIQVGLVIVNGVNVILGWLFLNAPPGRNTILAALVTGAFLTSDFISAGIGLSWLVVRKRLLADLALAARPPTPPAPVERLEVANDHSDQSSIH